MMLFFLVGLVIVVFWVTVIAAYAAVYGPGVLTASPYPDEARNGDAQETLRRREARIAEERAALQDDLTNIRIGAGEARTGFTELGVAENRTMAARDEHNEDKGDMWLCSYRPVLFALAYQLVPSWIVALICDAVIPWQPIWSAVTGFAVVTIPLALIAGVMVTENTRHGVKRFRKQLRGYLGEGLQFTLPWLEEGEDITFQAFVWGPHTTDSPDEAFHINGTVGGKTNPQPGKFVVYLAGRWAYIILTQITLRIRKSWKRSWWNVLNRYENTREIGEQIAAIVSSVLFTRAREIETEVNARLRTVNVTQEEPIKTRVINEVFRELQNSVPEMSGLILDALVAVGDDRLGGFLPLSVAISSEPGEELQQLLQIEDEAQVNRRQEELAGEAALLRSKNLQLALKGLDADERNAFLQLSAQEVQRLFAQAGGSNNSLEGLVRAFLAGKVQEVTATSPPSTTPPTQT